MNFNKILFGIMLFGFVFLFQTVEASSGKIYSIKGKDLTIQITQVDASKIDGLRDNEGILDISIKHKKTDSNKKDVRLSVICSDKNYLNFSDICNHDYVISSTPFRLHYVLNDEKKHNFNFEFSVGEFVGEIVGDDNNETIDYILKKKISIIKKYVSNSLIENNKKPSLFVVSPNGNELFKIGKTYPIKWLTTGIPENNSNMLIDLIDSRGFTTTSEFSQNSGIFNFTIPSETVAGKYKIQVICQTCGSLNNGNGLYDLSDRYFKIK